MSFSFGFSSNEPVDMHIRVRSFEKSNYVNKRKYRSISGLSKKSLRYEINRQNMKNGKQRRSSNKTRRFVEFVEDDDYESEDEYDNFSIAISLGSDCEIYMNDDLSSVTGSYTSCEFGELEEFEDSGFIEDEKDTNKNNVQLFDTSVDRQYMTLREIFQKWGISDSISGGIGGDGWNIGIEVCKELERNNIQILVKTGNPPVRMYDVHNWLVVLIIGKIVKQHLDNK